MLNSRRKSIRIAKRGIAPVCALIIASSGLAQEQEANDLKHQDTYTKSWSKEELYSKPKFQKTKDSFGIMGSYVVGMINDIGRLQKRKDKGIYAIQNKTQEMSHEEMLFRIGSRQSIEKDTDGKSIEMIQYLGTESQSIVGNRVKSNIPFLNEVNKGMNFSIGANSFTSPSEQEVDRISEYKGPKYGLILVGIKPPASSPGRVSIDSSFGDELKYATKAEPNWTIGPKQRENKKLFNFPSLQNNDSSSDSFINTPDLSFKGNVKPATDVIDDLRNNKNPGLILSMKQKDGFYELVRTTRNNANEDSTNHIFNLPLYESLGMQKIYDVDGKPIKTTLSGLLINKSNSDLSTTYIHETKKFTTKYTYKFEKHSFSFESKDLIDFTEDINKGSYKASYALNI